MKMPLIRNIIKFLLIPDGVSDLGEADPINDFDVDTFPPYHNGQIVYVQDYASKNCVNGKFQIQEIKHVCRREEYSTAVVATIFLMEVYLIECK